MYLVKTPRLIKALLPGFIWKMHTHRKVIYLTFDDGPIPEVTPWVLDTLSAYGAKGTFFCVGENVQRHPLLFRRLLQEGHTVGNHTFNHLNSCKTPQVDYLKNIRRCSQLVRSNLFRPPYGRISPGMHNLLSRHFHIIMWDVLSGDFDPGISKEQCLDNVLLNATEGSIVVMHDSLKAEEKLRYVLPRTLAFFTGLGYRFEAIPQIRREKPNLRETAAYAMAAMPGAAG